MSADHHAEGADPDVSVGVMSLGMILEMLRVASNESRLRILMQLEDAPIRSATLCEAVEMTRTSIAAHIAILKHSGLIVSKRIGHCADYQITAKGRICLAIVDALADD